MADTKFIKQLLLSPHFINATFENTTRPRIEKVKMRPVEIKGKRYMQISYLDGKRDVTKNFVGRQVFQKIGEVLAMEFRSITIETTTEEVTIAIDQRGKVKMTKRKVEGQELTLSHDRKKNHMLDEQKMYDFLVELGVQSQDGKIIADKRDKFKQINEFLKIIDETVNKNPEVHAHTTPGVVQEFGGVVRTVDFGCGTGYLTMAIHYYFQEILKRKVETIGVDLKEDLVRQGNEITKKLDWNSLKFIHNSIKDYMIGEKPDIVMSLHACDTATDDAIAQGIRSDASYIFAVPCCHKYMQQNLDKQKFPKTLHQIASHGILLQRTCDIVTDTFRALILRIKGYKTDVFEFVDSTHSAKNLMIRAIKLSHAPDVKTYKREYEELKKFWGVSPYLEKQVYTT